MDQLARTEEPVLAALARELAENERLQAFVAAPAAARVSEPLLPLFLAALHLASGGPLVCVLPEDGEARDAAEAAGWFLGDERVGLFASRGVGGDPGLRRRRPLTGGPAPPLDLRAAGASS